MLKVFNPRVFLPAFTFIKTGLYSELPFRDRHGFSDVSISFERDGIIVTHERRQVALSSADQENPFEFNVVLSLKFSKTRLELRAIRSEVAEIAVQGESRAQHNEFASILRRFQKSMDEAN